MTDPVKNVAAWLDSCQTRFKNMYDADLDKNGWPSLQQALKNFDERGYFTVGEIQYLWNRTHPMGLYPDYNTKRGYNKKFGNMLPCPLKALIDSNLVNWSTGKNGVIQDPLIRAIKKETSWEWRMGNLRAQQNTAFADLFGG
jgi:hypothetical protein